MKDSIKSMVNKFLSWKLPTNFYPDAGISFTPKYNVGTPYERNHEPIGTNLFDADQARQMFEYCCAEELTKREAAARQQGFEEGKQAGRDEVLTKLSEQEPEAHMYPSDLEKFSQSETFATAFSVAVGNPDENSIPMIRQPNKPDKE